MSKRTRISKAIDAQRLGALVSYPGIDPRVWVSICYVDKVHVDKDHGPFADVHIASTATLDANGDPVAQLETVRIAPDYAGNGFGAWYPPAVGDEVIVIWPDGHPDNGGILVKRLWSASDLSPKTVIDNPADCAIVVQKDVNLRILMQGKGDVILQIEQGQVLLGSETDASLDFVALAQKVLTQLSNIVNAFNAHTHPYVNVTTPATTSAPSTPMSSPSSVAAQDVKAV